MRTRLTPVVAAAVAALACLAALVPLSPAHAQGRVSAGNPQGDAVVDPTYATTLTVRGSGFQSVRGGHGGIYVFFGTVRGQWRPSQGGTSGTGYLYVPDSESRDNQGFQKYVAFPGSDTAGSANGGTIGADGTWQTTITVPGATFQAVGRNGAVETVDCREVTCGVITVGAHGVTNATNESFTPVRVADLTGGGEPPDAAPTADPSATPDASVTPEEPGATAAPTPGAAPATRAGPATLEVDRVSARAGNALAFAATGLPVGAQVSAVLDDGSAAAGPFLVGSDGGLSGVLTLPADLTAGTYELRLFGIEDPPAVSFAVAAADGVEAQSPPLTTSAAAGGGGSGTGTAGILFVCGAAMVLLLALLRLLLQRRRAVRRAA